MRAYGIDDREVLAWYDVQLRRIYYNEDSKAAHAVIIVLVFQH